MIERIEYDINYFSSMNFSTLAAKFQRDIDFIRLLVDENKKIDNC